METHVILPAVSPLAAAIEENLEAHIAFIARSAPGMRVFDHDDLLMVDSGLSSDTFNKVARSRLSSERAGRRISEVIEYFRAVDRPFAWWIGPSARPFDLETHLRDHGLIAAECEVGMAMDVSELQPALDPPRNLAIERVCTARQIAAFAEVVAANWQPPDQTVIRFYSRAVPVLLANACPMQLFVGYLDDEPVATAELFTSGSLGGLYSVSTRPEFRRRGIGSAVTWHAAEWARCAGARTLALQSSEAGQSVYARLGFKACCNFAEYTPW